MSTGRLPVQNLRFLKTDRLKSLKNNACTFQNQPKLSNRGYYGACDIFVNPSISETYGKVFVEAMSAGKAVVLTNGAGAATEDYALTIEFVSCKGRKK